MQDIKKRLPAPLCAFRLKRNGTHLEWQWLDVRTMPVDAQGYYTLPFTGLPKGGRGLTIPVACIWFARKPVRMCAQPQKSIPQGIT